MAKGKMLYKVCVYVGGYSSHETKVVYTCSKESDAQAYLHKYLKKHPEVYKAFIERSVNMRLNRNKYDSEIED